MATPNLKLHTSHGPNPRVVQLFLHAKAMTIPATWVDIGVAENRRDPFLSTVNPAGTTPVLVLDDGTHIGEVTAICEYLDEQCPDPPMIGLSSVERAVSRMWTRRVDLMFCEPMANAFRYGDMLDMFAPRMRCIPEAAEGLKMVARDGLTWIDAHFVGPWIAGERFGLSDVLLFAFVEFGNGVGNCPLPSELMRLADWFKRAQDRLDIAA